MDSHQCPLMLLPMVRCLVLAPRNNNKAALPLDFGAGEIEGAARPRRGWSVRRTPPMPTLQESIQVAITHRANSTFD